MAVVSKRQHVTPLFFDPIDHASCLHTLTYVTRTLSLDLHQPQHGKAYLLVLEKCDDDDERGREPPLQDRLDCSTGRASPTITSNNKPTIQSDQHEVPSSNCCCFGLCIGSLRLLPGDSANGCASVCHRLVDGEQQRRQQQQ